MSVDEFVALFSEQFVDPSEAAFCPETKFHELNGWTSMTALLVITIIEENFGVLISSDEFRDVQTIQELYDLIQKKKS